MIMVRAIAGALVLGMFATGCSLFQKKEEPKNEGGNAGGGGEQGGGGMDPTQFVSASSPVPFAAGKVKVGWSANQKMDSSGTVMNTSWAVVGEQGNSWLIEHKNPSMDAMAKGYIMGLTVNKEDGKVTKAVLGKPGEAGKPIKIQENPPYEAPKLTHTNEDVKIKLGTFPAKKYVNKFKGGDGKEQTMTTWSGNGGELNDVLLKSAGSGQDYELAEMPEDSTQKVGDSSVTVTKYAYTNGMTMWVANGNEVLTGFWPYGDQNGKSLFKMTTQGMTQEITDVSTAAKPQLKW